MSSAKITAALGMAPSRALERNSRDHPVGSREAVWILESGVADSLPLNDHVDSILADLEQRRDELKGLQEHCYFELWCAFASDDGQGSFVLEAQHMQRLADLNIDLIVSLYPPEASSE